jgi:serine/threonine-protein kinase HipA
MKRTITLKLGEEGRALGLLRNDQQGSRPSAAFEYAPKWLEAGDRFMIEPGLPLVTGPQFHRKAGQGWVFYAAIVDNEPDGWGKRVIQRDHAKRRQHARGRGLIQVRSIPRLSAGRGRHCPQGRTTATG